MANGRPSTLRLPLLPHPKSVPKRAVVTHSSETRSKTVAPFSSSSFWASPILMPLKPTSCSHRVPAEEVSEARNQRTGSGLRSTRDLE
jgi:hypothetical protein